MRNSPSYDKYGRIFFGLAADYALNAGPDLHRDHQRQLDGHRG